MIAFFEWSVIDGEIVSHNGDGSITVDWSTLSHMTADDGFGYLTVTPSDCPGGCTAETTLKVPVIRKDMEITGNATICGNTQSKYSLPQWPTTDFVWDIVNTGGTNASLVWNDQRNEVLVNPGNVAGSVILVCVYQNTLLNCGGRSELKVTIKNDVVLVGNKETCIGTTETYNIGGSSGVWTLRKLPSGPNVYYTGTSFTNTFTVAGQYGLTVNGTNFCSAKTFFIEVRSNPTPLATDVIGSRIVCPSSPSTFSIDNTVPNTIIGWSIPSGTGTIIGSNYGNEIQVIFEHPLPPGASYSLTVWRENINDPICKSPDLVIPLQLIPFDIVPITGEDHPCASSYQDYYVDETDGETYIWSVDPVDAGSVLVNGSKDVRILWNQFNVPTNATLKLKVTKCNVTEEVTLPVVIDEPHIDLVVPTGTFCRGEAITFSIDADPAITSGTITWDFGDGNIIIGGQTEVHEYLANYTTTTIFPVKVTIAAPNGCHNTITATNTVTIELTPKAYLSESYFEVCEEGDIDNNTVTAIPDTSFGPITSIVWYVNGVETTNPNTNQYIFTPTVYGTYYAIVSNGTCSSRTDSMMVADCNDCAIDPMPDMSLSLTEDCGTVYAIGTYTYNPGPGPTPNTIGYSSQVTPTLTIPGGVGFVFPTPGWKSVDYVLTFGECIIRKSAQKLVPYIADVYATISCGTSTQYSVTIHDSSLWYDGIPLIDRNREFRIDGTIIPLGSNPVDSRTMLLSPGTYTVKITIDDGTNPTCEKTINLVIPDLPDSWFEFTNDVCLGSSTDFTPVPQTGMTYSWNFGDGSFNLEQEPVREFSNAGPQTVILKVMDQFGCFSQTSRTLNVKRNSQNGEIAPPPLGCPGGSSILHFDPSTSGFEAVASYQWLLNNVPLSGANYNDFPATVSGSYSVIVGNANGCTRKLPQSVPVAIAAPPFSKVNGPIYACVGDPITLFVNPGNGSSLTYSWTRDDQPLVILSTSETMINIPSTTGTYIYTLSVDFPLSGGGTCTSTLTHTVTVDPLPVFTGGYWNVIECHPYEVTLAAMADTSDGVFNWSTGADGDTITEDEGGVYEVTYTSRGGCKISQQITVPKNPENYLWIFPHGCYKFCDKFEDGTLIGPEIAPFDEWAWLGSTPLLSGTTDVAPYHLPNQDGVYNLQLKTGNCEVISRDMHIDVVECECKIRANMLEATIETEPFFHYAITLDILNTSGSSMNVVVTANNGTGIITNGNVIVPNGGGTYTFLFIPNSGFTNPILLDLTSNGNPLCKGSVECMLPGSSRGVVNPIDRIYESEAHTNLSVIPNPVKDIVSFNYDYANETLSGEAVLIVYDLLGRPLAMYKPTSGKDIWKLDMSGYGDGNYVVVMKLNGKILEQKNLILTH